MPIRPSRRVASLAGGLAATALSVACAGGTAWTPIATNGMYPVEVDTARIRPADGAIEVWVRELYPRSMGHSIRERHTGVQLDCSTDQFRLIDVYVLARNGDRYRDSVVAGAPMYRPTPERAVGRPWMGAYRLPFKSDEVCARWGPAAAQPAETEVR